MDIDLTKIEVEDGGVFNTEEKKEAKEEKQEEKKETSSNEKIKEVKNESEEDNKGEEKQEDLNIEDSIENQQQEEYEESILTEIRNHFGYEIDGDFSEDIDGLKQYTTEVAKKMALDEFQQVFEAYPDVADYMQYRMNNGDPSKFFEINNEPDYSSIEINDDNESQAKDVIRAFFKEQGFTDDEIKDTITDYEDTGILTKQAKKVLPKLQSIHENKKRQLIEQKEVEKKKQIEEAKQYWSDVQNTINSGNIKNIAIPEADKKKFFEWLAIPKEGDKSQRDIERESMSVEDVLALEYLMYKKLDISKLSVSRQNTKDAEKLRSLLKKKGNAMKGSGSTYTPKGSKGEIGTIHDYIPTY